MLAVHLTLALGKKKTFAQLIDHFMEERERAEHGARGAIVPQSNQDGDPAAAAAPPPPGVDAQGRTPAMRVQEETVKLRTYLGFDVEQGGAGRCFQAGDSFVAVERRRDGAQVRMCYCCTSMCLGMCARWAVNFECMCAACVCVLVMQGS